MLRHIEDRTTSTRMRLRRPMTRAALTIIAALAAPAAFAHVGHHAVATPAPAAYVPYQGGRGDPLGLASVRYAEAGATTAYDNVAVDNPLATRVREENARFADVTVAAAEGYAPIPCVSGVEGGAMGIHYVNGALIEDGVIDIAKPEAVMYEPQADGSMQLVAVEYITTKGPASLDGHLFSFTGSPNRYGLPPFYELHVWAWRSNPTGIFADMNPHVSCDAAVAALN